MPAPRVARGSNLSRPLLHVLLAGLLVAPFAVAYHSPTPAGLFDVTFTNVKGNAWWVQTNVNVVDGGTLATVEVRRGEEAWRPMTDKGWAWTASLHMPQGTVVQFRATSTEGETDLSSCYLWTNATWTACPGEGATVRRLHFDHQGGNEWWVEVRLTGEAAPDVGTVIAFDDSDGDVGNLKLRSWGNWAGSMHLEPGHRVRFEALGYQLDELSCWFTHPQGVEMCDGSQTSPPPPGPDEPTSFDATFANVRGNAWWVEVDVSATGGPVNFVEAWINEGTRVILTKQSWGSWAKSVQVPPGATVRFVAYSTDGVSDASGYYTWPPQ